MELGVAELMATLPSPTDLANGRPQEKALRTCLLAVGLGRMLGLDPAALSDVYYLSMLRSVASTCFAPGETATANGDDHAIRRAFRALDDQDAMPLVHRAVARVRHGSGGGSVEKLRRRGLAQVSRPFGRHMGGGGYLSSDEERVHEY